MPQIRPTKYTDFNDQPLAEAYVYIYEVGGSYLDSSALLSLTDADTGAAISNPFRTNEYGYPKNTNGAQVNPVCAELSWAIRIESQQGVLVYTSPKQVADNFNEDVTGASVVDATYADLPEAKGANLTGFNTVYIQSLLAGWEGSLAGPLDGFYAHRDGTSGTPETGDENQFFDAEGSGFTRDGFQRVDEDQFIQNTADIATNTAAISALDADLFRQQVLNWQEVYTSNTTLTASGRALAFGLDSSGRDAFVLIGNDSVDDANAIAVSRKGSKWYVVNNPTSLSLSCVDYGDELFMAITSTGARTLTSPNGVTWTEQGGLGITTASVSDLAYNGSRWVCVTGNNAALNISTSDDDGATWTARTNPSTATNVGLANIIYGGGLFVAGSASIGSSIFVLTSSDGITWTEYDLDALGATTNIAGIAYGNSTYVVLIATAGGAGYEFFTSSDAVTWTRSTASNDNLSVREMAGIIFANGNFIAFSQGGEIITSADGITWTPQGSIDTTQFGSSCATYGAGRLVMAIGNDFFAGFSTGG